MLYKEKIFVVQPEEYETDLAVCKLDKKTGKYKPLCKVTESRYNIAMTKGELEKFKALMFGFTNTWQAISYTDILQFQYELEKIKKQEGK